MSDGRAIYKFMGLEPTASADDIKSAYRQRAKELHPDHGGSDKQFQRLQKAYGLLSDPARRAQWHRDHNLPPLNGAPPPEADPHPPADCNWVCMACGQVRHRCTSCDVGLCDHEAFFVMGRPVCRACKKSYIERNHADWRLKRMVREKFGSSLDDLFGRSR